MKFSSVASFFLITYALASNATLADEKKSLNFSFGSPEIIKLDWSTRSLTPVDLNSDGLKDLAVINNDAGKIELLYQLPKGKPAGRQKRAVSRSRWEPVLEDALFDKQAITVGFTVFDMVAHDLNGDGRVDLAYTSREVPLTIRYQSEEGEWIDSQEYDRFEALGWLNSIKATDIDGDGSVELFVLTTDAIRVFSHNKDGTLSEPKLLYISGDNPFNMMLFDATGDGLSDLLYLSTDGKQVLAMREQIEGGNFGPETRHVMERPARVIVPLEPSSGLPPMLVAVNSRSGSLEFMRFSVQGDGKRKTESALLDRSPEIYPIFNKVRESASYAVGDVDGDGEDDLVVANPADAELVLFTKTKGRFQASKAYPSFSSVSSLSPGRFYKGKRESLIVLSEAEKTMGLSELEGKARLSFPRQIKIGPGDPVVTSAADLDGDGYDELLLINQAKEGYSLTVGVPVNRKDKESGWNVLFEMELKGVRRKPTAVADLDVFAKGKPGLIVYVPREPPVLLQPVHGEEGLNFELVADDSSIRESLFKALSPAETSAFDVDSDGVNELVVARTGFARAFKLLGDELVMVDQFNARRGSDKIDAAIPLYSKSEVSSIALYISEEREVQFLERDPAGVFRYDRAVKLGALDLQNWYRLPASKRTAEDAYIFAGKDRFWYFNSEASTSTWVIDDVYETDIEDVHYSHLAGADFNQDRIMDFVALDGNTHVVDILSADQGELGSKMFWQVFEQNMHYQGRTGANLEPRQIVIDDLTGDGLLDLALLVHDRILIYPQK